jgi:hypothetical protein
MVVTSDSRRRTLGTDDLPKIAEPATRALAGIGVLKLSQLVDHTDALGAALESPT